jgi:hypothetical protein
MKRSDPWLMFGYGVLLGVALSNLIWIAVVRAVVQ